MHSTNSMRTISRIILVVLLYTVMACNSQTNTSEKLQELAAQPDTLQAQRNPYQNLRDLALHTKTDDIGITVPDGSSVYGIVMDWDLGEGIVTLIAFKTGDASMYLSSGGGMIGGGQHDAVREAVFSYLKKSQEYLSQTNQSQATSLPDKNCIQFYLLTEDGIYHAKETMANIENQTSAWLALFAEANNVITELRQASEGK